MKLLLVLVGWALLTSCQGEEYVKKQLTKDQRIIVRDGKTIWQIKRDGRWRDE